MLKAAWNYLLISVFCMVFGMIYEHFSFGVYSVYMQYAFSIPLLLGCVPALWLQMHPERKRPGIWMARLWHAGIATWCVGSVFTGAVQIYGTGSRFSIVYLVVGLLCLVAALLTRVAKL